MVEKYYDGDGSVGVLYSPGFGAGWSTWNNNELAFDKRIVEKWLNERPDEDTMRDYIISLGYPEPYMGGYRDLEFAVVPKGKTVFIGEYDGSESIETIDNLPIICGD